MKNFGFFDLTKNYAEANDLIDEKAIPKKNLFANLNKNAELRSFQKSLSDNTFLIDSQKR